MLATVTTVLKKSFRKPEKKIDYARITTDQRDYFIEGNIEDNLEEYGIICNKMEKELLSLEQRYQEDWINKIIMLETYDSGLEIIEHSEIKQLFNNTMKEISRITGEQITPSQDVVQFAVRRKKTPDEAAQFILIDCILVDLKDYISGYENLEKVRIIMREIIDIIHKLRNDHSDIALILYALHEINIKHWIKKDDSHINEMQNTLDLGDYIIKYKKWPETRIWDFLEV